MEMLECCLVDRISHSSTSRRLPGSPSNVLVDLAIELELTDSEWAAHPHGNGKNIRLL